MKKLIKLLVLVLFILVLNSCDGVYPNITSTASLTSQTVSSSSRASQSVESISSYNGSSSSTSNNSSTSKSSSTYSSSSSIASSIYSSSSSTYSSTYSSSTQSSSSRIDYPLSTLSYDKYDEPSGIGKYETGTYIEDDSTNLGFYRCYSEDYNELAVILATPTKTPGLQQSMVYNLKPILGIEKIEIEYKSSSIAYLFYSNDRSYSHSIELPASRTFTTIRLDIQRSAYFRVAADKSDVYLKSLTLEYNGVTPASPLNPVYSNDRIGVEYTDFDNIADLTVRSIPDKIKVNSDGTYTVESSKSYTYYSYNYAIKHPGMINTMALTDPIDVANYYTLFHDFPVNYGYKGDVYDLKDHFNNYSGIRQVSHYSRTDGYALSVPFSRNSNNKVDYYELDFDVDGTYSTGRRGVGRLVVWEYGFDKKDYTHIPVIVYTDDHYATFKEYLNYGQFGTRFNAEKKGVTSYSWSTPTTLDLAS